MFVHLWLSLALGAGCPLALQEPARLPGDPDAALGAGLRERLRRVDPAHDDWGSEAAQEQAARAMGRLLRWLAGHDEAESSPPCLAAAVVFSPPGERTAARPGPGLGLTVRTLPADRARTGGRAEFARSLQTWERAWSGGAAVILHSKALRVTPPTGSGAGEYGVWFRIHGWTTDRLHEAVALWRTEWSPGDGDEDPQLTSLMPGETVIVDRRGTRPLFEDSSEFVLGAGGVFRDQLLPGQDYWQSRIAAGLGVSSLGHHGVAVGDVDGDGLEDLYLCQPGGLPNLLLLHQPDGTTRPAGRTAGAAFLEASRCALLIDLDGDGDLDLVTDVLADLVFLENDGTGRFTPRTGVPAPETTSLAAADFDADGDLDVYVCGYLDPYDDRAVPMPYHDANNGQRNLLLRNDGGFRFSDATKDAGLEANNRRFSFAAAWEDYDDDGDPDLYVANDFGRNNLYRNDGGVFTDVAAYAGVEDVAAGMGVSWGDPDRDGRMDLYVSDMFSAAGRRVAFQERFQAGTPASVREQFRHHAWGNTLFANLGGGRFRDSGQAVVAGWAWGGIFLDFNNDAWEDLFVPNGFVTAELDDDL